MSLEEQIQNHIEALISNQDWSAIADLIMQDDTAEMASDYFYSRECSASAEQKEWVEELY